MSVSLTTSPADPEGCATAAVAVVLTTSMRDFAIAVGPAAAAPLGLYGILALAWGTAAGGILRQRR